MSKKKKTSLILLILLSLVFTSCGRFLREKEINDKKSGVSTKTPENTHGYDISANQSANAGDAVYNIADAIYTDKEIEIKYPQLTGMDDVAFQEKINNLIKHEALKILDVYADPDVTMDIEYKITTKGPRFLSIQYLGYQNTTGAAHPVNVFYTTNINLDTGSKVKLSDVVTIDQAFLEKFKKGTYVKWDPDLEIPKEYLEDYINKDYLIEEFKNADSLGEENGSNTFSYFTEDALGISISVPHALGDHVEIEIKYADLSKYQ